MLPSLRDIFGRINDPRAKKGQRYPLPGLLSLVFLALASGVNSLRQIAAWSRAQPQLSDRLGFRRGKMPGYTAIRRILVDIDVQELEETLRDLVEAAGAEKASPSKWPAISIDGKTVRGSGKGDLPALQLLGAVAHGSKWVLAEAAIPPGTSEQTAVKSFLDRLELEGHVVTLDALHTHRDTAEVILKKGATTSCV